MGQHSLSIQQSKTAAALMHATNDLERIGDHAENIMELAEAKMDEKLPFSEAAINELQDLYHRVDKHLEKPSPPLKKKTRPWPGKSSMKMILSTTWSEPCASTILRGSMRRSACPSQGSSTWIF
jgi:hypothetical protein